MLDFKACTTLGDDREQLEFILSSSSALRASFTLAGTKIPGWITSWSSRIIDVHRACQGAAECVTPARSFFDGTSKGSASTSHEAKTVTAAAWVLEDQPKLNFGKLGNAQHSIRKLESPDSLWSYCDIRASNCSNCLRRGRLVSALVHNLSRGASAVLAFSRSPCAR